MFKGYVINVIVLNILKNNDEKSIKLLVNIKAKLIIEKE